MGGKQEVLKKFDSSFKLAFFESHWRQSESKVHIWYAQMTLSIKELFDTDVGIFSSSLRLRGESVEDCSSSLFCHA